MRIGRRHRPPVAIVLLLASPLGLGHAKAQGAGTQGARPALVDHLLGLAEAASGVYGDEGARLEAHLRGMQGALARWDRELATAEVNLARQARGPDAARAAVARALAIRFLDHGRLEDAERELASALDLDRRRADVWQLLGVVRSRLGRPAQAAEALAEATRLEPGDPIAWYLLADQSRHAGDPGEMTRARDAFQRTTRERLRRQGSVGHGAPFLEWGLLQEPSGARPYFLPAAYAAGLTLLRQGRYTDALTSFQAAVAVDPLVASAGASRDRLARAGAALRQGDLPEALGLLQALVSDVPDFAEAHRIMGNAFRAAGRHAESVAALETAVELQPANERARVALADVLAAGGRTTEAVQALRGTIALLPASGLAHSRLAELSSTVRDYVSARGALESAIDIRPLVGAGALYRALSELPRAREADGETAIEHQRRRVALDLNDTGARVALGTACLDADDNDCAVVELLAALLIEPGHVAANAALAQASLRLGDQDGAVAAARRALAGDADDPEAQYVLATALARLGDTDQSSTAFERYRRMLDEAQADRRRDFDLGLLLEEAREHASRGAIDEAVTSLRAGMELRPKDPALRVSIGLLLLSGQQPLAAVAELEQALALGAGPEIHQHLAAAYDALNRREDARRHQELYERSLRSDPPRP